MGYFNRKKYSQVSQSSVSGSCGESGNNSCSGCDECWNQYEECKNQQNQSCDGCCVRGIKNVLTSLKNQTVQIDTKGRSYVGIVSSVNCDVVQLDASTGTTATILSICQIEAIIPAASTLVVTADFNLDRIANKAK
ncbi:hypothetical protein [Bacillus toyonensis]|uniref:hypothetical protein n=1 Tax=Bacillus toyonensis TaxID=155322 RepID=UPI003D650226